MSLLKKLAGETAIYGLSSIVGRLLNYLLVPLYTEVFAPEEYGVVTHLYAWVGFLMVLFVYRMETAFFRFGTAEGQREQAFSTAFWSVSATTVVFASAIIFFSGNLAGLLEYSPGQSVYFAIFGLVLAFDSLSEIPLARLRLDNRPKRFAFVRMTNIGLNIFFNLFFLMFCPWALAQGDGFFLSGFIQKIYTPEFGVGYIFLSNLIASAAMFLLLLPEIRRIEWSFDGQLWRRMFAYSAPLVLAGMAGIVNEVADRQLLLELLPGTVEFRRGEVGIYSACYKLAILMAMFTQAFRYAAEPFFFANANKENAKSIYAEVAKYFAIAGAFVFLAVTSYLPILKHFIRSEEYWAGLGVVPILLMANLFLGLYYNISIWYKLTDQTKMGAYIALGGAAITIGLNVILIPHIGYMGSAWATLACYMSMTWAAWFFGKKHFPINYNWKKIGMYIGLAMSFYGFSKAVSSQFEVGEESLFFINTFLLIIYSFVAWRFEKNSISTAS